MAEEPANEMSKEEYEKMTGYTRLRAWYLVAMMSLSFGMGELSHYLVGSTTKLMAQELHYGDMICFTNSSVPANNITTCSSFKNATE